MSEIDHGSKARVLIVDDVNENLHALVSILRDKYAVVAATSGEKAIELAARQPPPDLILLDIKMPVMDGYEVCRRLKQMPETRHIPVIFVTALTDILDEEYGLSLGAVDYITKPFHPAIVLARVQNHVNLKLKIDLLESQAMLDGLTCISNRRRFDAVLESEWKRTLRSSSPLSLIMADVDFFKYYNDHYGHAEGDVCLKKVAASLAKTINRPSDLVARYGGEEFVAILPETDERGARSLAEHFRSQVECLQIPHEYSAVSKYVTVSVGVASAVPTPEMTAADLLKLADDQLYLAKHEGRNRVA